MFLCKDDSLEEVLLAETMELLPETLDEKFSLLAGKWSCTLGTVLLWMFVYKLLFGGRGPLGDLDSGS